MSVVVLLSVVLVTALVLVFVWRSLPPPHPGSTAGSGAADGSTRQRWDSPLSRSSWERPRLRRLALPVLRPKQAPPPGAGEVFAIVSRRPSPTRHPIVLAQGYMGFDWAVPGGPRREYFLGVRERLEALGHTVHRVRVAPAGGISLRAAQLARQIQSLPAPRVNIIAHSMGGLDARYAIARLGLGERVASLTTVGTPHRGTPLADTGALWIGEWRHLRQLLNALGANVDGLYDLTTRRMEEFNRAVPDCSDVYYSSVVGAVSAATAQLNTILAAGHAYLLRTAGSNDGIVPAESQKWGDVLGEVDADHWEQIGWSGNFDAQAFYATLAEHLAAWGL
jgi:triacylglycerol lipase